MDKVLVNTVDVDSSLKEHRNSLRSKSYALAAAPSMSNVLAVSSPSVNSDFGRPRPRTVFVHGFVNPRVLLDRLRSVMHVPYQIQVLLNGDVAVTFKSSEDKDLFLNLDFVSSAVVESSRPVWVRVHFKLGEKKSLVVKERLSNFGSVLFFRGNGILDSEVLSGSLNFKMILHTPIPSFLYIGPFCLVVHYDAQTHTCRKCNSPGHRARLWFIWPS